MYFCLVVTNLASNTHFKSVSSKSFSISLNISFACSLSAFLFSISATATITNALPLALPPFGNCLSSSFSFGVVFLLFLSFSWGFNL